MVGAGLMLYNYLRFDQLLEFGQRYQLAGMHVGKATLFSPAYAWFNFRVYFLEPVHWLEDFPFVAGIRPPPTPPGHLGIDGAFGVLTNVPFIWLALALPLSWRHATGTGRSMLHWFWAAVGWLALTGLLPLLFFAGATGRYETEFMPALTLLAVGGVLSLEQALAGTPGWRRATRWLWSTTLVASVVFNFLASYQVTPQSLTADGNLLYTTGRVNEAAHLLENALRIDPNLAEAHHSLGIASYRLGRTHEAIGHFQRALALKPDFAEAHNALGVAFLAVQRPADAKARFEEALRLKPDFVEARYDLGLALSRLGARDAAIDQWERAVKLNPNFPGLRESLARARQNRTDVTAPQK
jgi:tetratricopeptide (TPR) repeat protein